MKNKRWTQNDIDMLNYLASEGWASARIARELDRTKKAVDMALYKQGHSRRKARKPRAIAVNPVVNTAAPTPTDLVVTGTLNERSFVYGFVIGCITGSAVVSAMYLGVA